MFISATKNDARSDRSLSRGEFYDFILRVAFEKYKKYTKIQKQ